MSQNTSTEKGQREYGHIQPPADIRLKYQSRFFQTNEYTKQLSHKSHGKKNKKQKEERITFCVYPALASDSEIKSLFLLRLSINVNQIKRKEKSHKE